MLSTWKAIQAATGFSRGTLKRLAEEEGFPIVYVAGRPCTMPTMIEKWLSGRHEAAQKAPKKSPVK